MRLVDNLRKAEEKGVMRIRRGVDRAREEWADVERRIRQRMRIYPHKQQAAAAGVRGGSTWSRMYQSIHLTKPASRLFQFADRI